MINEFIGPLVNVVEEGGVIIFCIFILSIALYGTLFRALHLTMTTSAPYKKIKLANQSLSTSGKLNPYWKNLHTGLEGFSDNAHMAISYLMFARRRIQRSVASKLLHIKVATAAAPLLGLLGTITGMIQTFAALSTGGGDDTSSMVASGISKALLTTNAGLVVAIPAIFLTYLVKRYMNRTLAIFSALETDFLNNSGSLRSMEGHP
jgi:biopolymer transport protein ExbB|tara:strand:+ start:26 stop:643 length:618 start_codon:yes stop_codon:yes gene_type:complete